MPLKQISDMELELNDFSQPSPKVKDSGISYIFRGRE